MCGSQNDYHLFWSITIIEHQYWWIWTSLATPFVRKSTPPNGQAKYQIINWNLYHHRSRYIQFLRKQQLEHVLCKKTMDFNKPIIMLKLGISSWWSNKGMAQHGQCFDRRTESHNYRSSVFLNGFGHALIYVTILHPTIDNEWKPFAASALFIMSIHFKLDTSIIDPQFILCLLWLYAWAIRNIHCQRTSRLMCRLLLWPVHG